MSRYLSFAMAALVASATGCTNWEAHEYPDLGFRAEFTTAPNVSPTIPEPGNWGTHTTVCSDDFTPELYACVEVHVRQLEFEEGSDDPDYRGNDSADRFFTELTRGKGGFRQYRQSAVESGGLEGFEAIEVRLDDEDDEDDADVLDVTLDATLDEIYALHAKHSMRRVRYYIDREGRRVFVVSLNASIGDGEELRSNVANHFLESFEIIGDGKK